MDEHTYCKVCEEVYEEMELTERILPKMDQSINVLDQERFALWKVKTGQNKEMFFSHPSHTALKSVS